MYRFRRLATLTRGVALACGIALAVVGWLQPVPVAAQAPAKTPNYQYHDSHFHLTNYVQEGITAKQYLEIMGDRVGRSTVFGLPLQQQWSYRISGDDAPTYYLDTDARLYYYSFCDAYIAMQYMSLTEAERDRLDPMIIGFNPTDMYAADHIRRVLLTFPGVFSGIGEFSIHKEFVSSKIAGDIASLTDPALDRILDFAAEAGLPVLLHNDVDRPFPREGEPPIFLSQFKALIARHPDATVIWAHLGLGRVIQPVENMLEMVTSLLEGPASSNLYFDISWDEVAKYALASPEATRRTADVLNKYPERFLFGTDNVASPTPEKYFAVYDMWQPVWDLLTDDAKDMILKGNYERIYDKARRDVRAWEKSHLP
jgi:hypothetical protein